MQKDNRLSINELREIKDLIVAEIKHLETSNLSIRKTIERLERLPIKEKQREAVDIQILVASKEVYKLQSEKIKRLSSLCKRITNIYLKNIKER